MGRLQTVGYAATGRWFRTFEPETREGCYRALLAESGPSANHPQSDVHRGL